MIKQINNSSVLSQKYLKCQDVMVIMGDPIRQTLIRCLLESKSDEGLRVGDLQCYTDLSRTMISHHLKVLREAGVVAVDRKSTKNYYYIDPQNTTLTGLIDFWKEVETILK